MTQRPPYLPPQDSISEGYGPQKKPGEARLQEPDRVVRRQQQQMEGLLKISATLRQSQTPQEAMRAIVTQISELLEADRTTIYELTEDKLSLQGIAVQGEESVAVSVPNGRGIVGLVTSTKRVINLKDAYDHPSFNMRVDRLTGYRTRSMLCVPMLDAQGVVIGAVQVLNKLTAPYFSEEDKQLLISLSAQAAMTLEALKLTHKLRASHKDLEELSLQAKRQLEEQELLFYVERVASNADEPLHLAEGALLRAAQVMEADLVALFVPNAEGRGPAYLQELHPTRGGIEGALKLNEKGLYLLDRVTVGEGLLGKLASRGDELILLGPCFELEALPRVLSERCTYEVNDVLATPLFDDQEPIGALLFINSETLRGYSQEQPRRGDSLYELGGASLNIRQLACFEGVPAAVREQATRRLRLASLISSQLGRAAAQLARRGLARQQDRLMTIGQMLSGLLHDMRGPMTSISGYSQLMARSQDEQERGEMARTITRKIKELNEMTREVLSFAKGERTVLSRKVYLKQFVDYVLESMRSELDPSGVSLQVKGDLSGVAYFDEVKMHRVVINIARNAKQAMMQAIASASMNRAPQFTWSVERGGSAESPTLTFTLTDNGPGIPEVIRGRVFEAFTTSGKAEGTGLGLAIVKQLIEDHEGRIELTTRTGEGTSFRLTLPQPPLDPTP